MDYIWSSLCDSLPKGDELTANHVKQLHHHLPVPSDYKILWAISEQFGKTPQGLVIADKGIVIKSNQPDTVSTSDKDKKDTSVYFIIPWHQFDPDEYKLDVRHGKVTITLSEGVCAYFSNVQIGAFFLKAIDKKRKFNVQQARMAEAGAAAELNTLGINDTIFAASYGADASKTGHGIYAEEASAILDKLHGEKVEVVGRDNAANGPDKTVNQQPVQCKYHQSATRSVNSCFKNNPTTGTKEFRYYTLDGKPMMIEVPKDQYTAAIEAMKAKIRANQVPGVTDPNMAYEIIRPGKLTQIQAKNLAKAGTFESLTYDAATGAVVCSFAFGISVLTAFGFSYASSKDFDASLKSAVAVGLQTFGLAFASQILTTQLAKTGLERSLIPASNAVVKALGNNVTKKLINGIRALLGKDAIYGNAAAKSLAKALRNTTVVIGIQLVVFSVPDTYRVVNKKMSSGQYAQNMTTLVSSILGAAAGTLAAGAATAEVTKRIGKKIHPTFGSAIGYTVGMVTGTGAAYGVKTVSGTLREDDAVIMSRLFNGVMINTFIDNMLSEEEIDAFFRQIQENKDCSKEMKKTLSNLYGSDHQYQDLEQLCNHILDPILKEREVITKDKEPTEDDISNALGDILEQVSEQESNEEP